MEANPYQAPDSRQRPVTALENAGNGTQSERLGCVAATLIGALAATLGSFPIAALVAIVYRFPVPFSGYESGFGAILRVLFAVLFYGALGGFLLVSVLGGLAGLLGRQIAKAAHAGRSQSLYITLSFALAAVIPPVVLLAVLDKIIGPW